MSKYWEERLLENQYKVGTKKMDKEILKVYQSATKEIRALVADLWLKMLQDGTLTQNGLYQYGRYLKLQEQINQILVNLGQQEINVINAQLTDLYTNTFAGATQALGDDSFSLVNEQVAKEVVNANFKGAVYSDRIWQRQDELKNQLMRVITNSTVVGKDWKTVSKDLAQRLEVGLSDSRRLVRTETMRVLNDACVNSARERGYDTYHVLLESDACDECKSLEDKSFSTTEKVLPVHPHCRCCAVIDIDDIGTHAIGDRNRTSDTSVSYENTAEVEKCISRMKQMGVNIIDIPHIKNGEVLSPFLDELEKLKSEHNIMFNTIKTIDISENTIAQVRGSVLELNQRYFNNQNVINVQLKDWNKNKIIPKGCNSIEYVAIHEYMHLLTQDKISNKESKVNAIYRRAENKDFVSRNALRDAHEFTADLLTAHRLKGITNKSIKELVKIFGGD